MSRYWIGCASAVAQTAVSISIPGNHRKSRRFFAPNIQLPTSNIQLPKLLGRDHWMLGVRCWLLDVLVAAWPRCAVSPPASRRGAGWREGVVSLAVMWRTGSARSSSAPRGRNQIVLVVVLVLDCRVSD